MPKCGCKKSSKGKPSRKQSRKQKGGFLGSNKQSNKKSNKKSRKVILRKLIKQGNKVTFAAKLAAFVLENHKGKEVKFAEEGGFHNDQNFIFGILPFLHLNIKKDQFSTLLAKGQHPLIQELTDLCSKSDAVKEIKREVDFQCDAQSSTGIRDGLIESVIENIDSPRRWASRKHGRTIAKEVAKNMNFQVDKELISQASVEWANNFFKKSH